MGKIQLEVVTPDKVVVSREVDMVVAPGSEGEFGVLPGHIHFLSGILPGELRYTAGSESVSVVVMRGFAEVSDDRVSILVDAAEEAREIDINRAQKAIERAQERLEKERGSQDVDFLRAKMALERAMARMKVAKKMA